MSQLTHVIKLNPRKHMRCGKGESGYRFYIYYLIDDNELDDYLEDRCYLLYKRDMVSIVYRDYYLSKETLDAMFYYSEKF